VSGPVIRYRQLPGVDRSQERTALAACYGFILKCHEERKAVKRDGNQMRLGGTRRSVQ
jgi:hypothetical protein